MTAIKARIKDIQTQIAAARAEIDQRRAQLGTLEAERAAQYVPHARTIYPNGVPPEVECQQQRAREVTEGIADANGRIEHLERHVIRPLEARLAYYTRADTAAADIEAARRTHADALKEVETASAAREQVQARIAAIQREVDTAVAGALAAEQAAANAYAAAVASGADEAQQQADEALRAARAASATTEQHTSRQRIVVEALGAEAARLDTRKADAQARATEAKQSLARAIEIQYAVQWDAALEQLAQAGAGMSAARRLGGFERRSVIDHRLSVPRMEPECGPLTAAGIHLLGDGLDLDEVR